VPKSCRCKIPSGPALPPSHEAKGGVDLAENAGDSPLGVREIFSGSKPAPNFNLYKPLATTSYYCSYCTSYLRANSKAKKKLVAIVGELIVTIVAWTIPWLWAVNELQQLTSGPSLVLVLPQSVAFRITENRKIDSRCEAVQNRGMSTEPKLKWNTEEFNKKRTGKYTAYP
jgi:hypothetical protein